MSARRQSFLSARSRSSRQSISSFFSAGLEKTLPVLDLLLEPNSKRSTRFSVSATAFHKGSRLEKTFVLVQGSESSGASAKIFKAYLRKPSGQGFKPIAIKRMHYATVAEDNPEAFYELLDREKRALEALSNDFICSKYITKYFGAYKHLERGEDWLIMEHCDGGSLKSIVAQGDVPSLQQLAAISSGVLKGLEHIHRLGFIHHDIKPANILLCFPGIVKLCDFGLTSTRADLHALGTVRYMSPEHMFKNLLLDREDEFAERVHYGSKSDIWSFGVTLLEVILGAPPLKQLRTHDETDEDFCEYIASFYALRAGKNQGSALGMMFFLEYEYARLANENVNVPSDLFLLCHRVKFLSDNRRHLHRLLLQPHLSSKLDNNNMVVPKTNHRMKTWSNIFDFLGRCFMCLERRRPTAVQLQNHPFVYAASKELRMLEPKLNELRFKYRDRAQRANLFSIFKVSLTVRPINQLLLVERQIQKQNHH